MLRGSIRRPRRPVLAAAVVAALLLAAPAAAQPPSPEPEALGAALAHELLTAADIRSVYVR